MDNKPTDGMDYLDMDYLDFKKLADLKKAEEERLRKLLVAQGKHINKFKS